MATEVLVKGRIIGAADPRQAKNGTWYTSLLLEDADVEEFRQNNATYIWNEREGVDALPGLYKNAHDTRYAVWAAHERAEAQAKGKGKDL